MTELEVKATVPVTPELLGNMFARMDSVQQAEALAECWRQMAEQYGGSYKAAMQCAYLRDDLKEQGDAQELLAHLADDVNEDPGGWVMPVERQPTMAELLRLRAYLAAELEKRGGPPLPKTYTVEKRHDDGTVSVVNGLSADEVRASYRAHHDEAAMARMEEVLDRIGYDDIVRVCHEIETDTVRTARSLAERRITVGTRTIVTLRNQMQGVPRYQPGERVAVEGMAIGTVLNVNPDGTVDVAMDYHMPDLSKSDWPRKDETYGGYVARIEDGEPYPVTSVDGDPDHPLVSKAAVCSECKGTGWYTGFTKREPCSQGCKPSV